VQIRSDLASTVSRIASIAFPVPIIGKVRLRVEEAQISTNTGP
jgi:hypothetical protein